MSIGCRTSSPYSHTHSTLLYCGGSPGIGNASSAKLSAATSYSAAISSAENLASTAGMLKQRSCSRDCRLDCTLRGCAAAERELLVVENVSDRKATRHASACHTTDAVISTRRVSRKRSSRTIQDWERALCVACGERRSALAAANSGCSTGGIASRRAAGGAGRRTSWSSVAASGRARGRGQKDVMRES